jgi:hypothetical protein
LKFPSSSMSTRLLRACPPSVRNRWRLQNHAWTHATVGETPREFCVRNDARESHVCALAQATTGRRLRRAHSISVAARRRPRGEPSDGAGACWRASCASGNREAAISRWAAKLVWAVPLADSWEVLDNSGRGEPTEVASGSDSTVLLVSNPDTWKMLRDTFHG